MAAEVGRFAGRRTGRRRRRRRVQVQRDAGAGDRVDAPPDGLGRGRRRRRRGRRPPPRRLRDPTGPGSTEFVRLPFFLLLLFFYAGAFQITKRPETDDSDDLPYELMTLGQLQNWTDAIGTGTAKAQVPP